MKKNMKILNFIIILMLFFSTIVFSGIESFALDSHIPATQTMTGEKQSDNNAIKHSTIPEKNAYALTHMKKNGIKYGILKFLMAMIGVIISSLAIFLGLKIYKKFILKNDAKLGNMDYDKTLESPRDFKEAINLFLNKTKKL